MITIEQLKELIKKELEEGIYPATSRKDFSIGPSPMRKRGPIDLQQLEKHKQEMKVVGHLERALETLELIGDDRDETRGAIVKIRDMIYNETGLDIRPQGKD